MSESPSDVGVRVEMVENLPRFVGGRTAGRYGVGLTLCVLHSNLSTASATAITSKVRGSPIERTCKLKPNVESDCIEKVEETERQAPPEASGTTVSMLIPGSSENFVGCVESFPRVAEYLSRFHLLSSTSGVSMRVVAPALSRSPLVVSPAPGDIEGVRSYLSMPTLQGNQVATSNAKVGEGGRNIEVSGKQQIYRISNLSLLLSLSLSLSLSL